MMRSSGSRAVKWLIAAVVCVYPMHGIAALNGVNTVNSAAIIKADGTSGQTLTTGNGVKTGHIQDKAITNAKLFGNISGSKLSNNTVTGAKIAVGTITGSNLATGAVAAAAIVNGAVTTAKIANGAVTDAQISGTISGNKLGAHGHNASDIVGTINVANLPVGTSSANVAVGDHLHDSNYQKKYTNVIVVAKSGGDYTDPVAALDAIWDSSQVNTYLVKVMPGVYEITADTWLFMKPYVDLEGSGEGVTKITTSILSGRTYGLLNDAPNSEVRNITIEANRDLGSYAVSIKNSSSLRNVTISSNSPLHNNPIGIIINGTNPLVKITPVLRNVTVSISGGDRVDSAAISNRNYADTKIFDSFIKANGVDSVTGIYNANGSSVKLYNSSVASDGIALANYSGLIAAVNSQFQALNITTPVGGIYKCLNSFDSNFNPIVCP